MARKRKTLPSNFATLLEKADIQELMEVFKKCQLDAYGSYNKQTALAFDQCPHALAEWLVAQGADLQARDTYGRTPLHNRAGSWQGNITSLLELGADVNDNHSYAATPLHAAVHKPENTQLLLAYWANVDALDKHGLTALEVALRQSTNSQLKDTLLVAKMHLDAGAKITSNMQAYVTDLGKSFEFYRADFAKDAVDETSAALDELYKLFGVEPVARRLVHDGKSPISVGAGRWQTQHRELWELLVPGSSSAETLQGEVIRISGRIANELDGNGGGNWDADYKKMADAFLEFVQQGKPLSSTEFTETQSLIKTLKRKAGDPKRLCELAVRWVIDNPAPIKCPAVSYKR